MSENNYEVPASPGTREEVYLDAILRGLNNSSPTPEIPAPVWRTEQYLAAIAEAAKTPALPTVTAADNGKVLCVGPNGWEAANIDNTDRQIWIYATIGNDGSISTMSTVSYEALEQLNGGFTLVARINDEYEFSLATVYLSKKEVTDAFFVFEGTYLDILALKQKSFIVAIPIPSPGSSSNVVIAWKEDKFIVTLTPTSPDYSGTMDKTVAEITAAYEAGMEIWFKVLTSASTSFEVPLTYWAIDSDYDYHGFAANIVDAASNLLIVAFVGSTSNGTKQTYATKVYSLTPAS